MKFVCYTDWQQLPESASALFAQAERESLFSSRPWFECLTATALETDNKLILACVVSGDKVMAVLPLMQCEGIKTWYSLRHGFTPIYNLLLAQDDQAQVMACLADGLTHLPVNGLLLEPVAGDDSTLNGMQERLAAAGYDCEYRFRHYTNPYIN